MAETGERGYASVAGFCAGAVAGFVAWAGVLAVAGPDAGGGADFWVAPVFGVVRPAVEEGTGYALLASSALWLFLVVSLLGVFLAALLVRTVVRGSSPTPVSLGITLAPVALPFLLHLVNPVLPVADRGDPSHFLYYGLVWHVPHAGVLLLAAWAGARAAELREEALRG